MDYENAQNEINDMTREEFIDVLPELTQGYQAPDEANERIRHIDLLMMVGGTGVGKTSIIKRLGVPFVVTDTTRAIRPSEINGLDYFFRTDYKQLANEIKERKFVQVMVYPTGDFYGTRISAYPEVGYAVFAVVSNLISGFRQMGFNETTTAFVTPPSFLEWMDRLGKSGMERDQLEKRLAEAHSSYKFALNDPDTFFILNDKLEHAVLQTKALLAGKHDTEREATGRKAAEEIFEKLSFA